MIHILNDQERSRLDRRIGAVEKRTGAQIVLAVVKRSDSYAEIPWKAFALAASIAGLFMFFQAMLRPEWSALTAVSRALATTLAAGAACAFMTVCLPSFARFFLSAHRTETEVRQHAETLFLSHQLFATQKRSGILLLVSLFERQVIVLPDTGLSERLSREATQEIISVMASSLASGAVTGALEKGLDKLEEILAATATGAGEGGEHELPDEIIEEDGS